MAPNWLNNAIQPQAVRRLRTAIPGYPQNRKRAATILHHGFRTYDAYRLARPTLFWTGIFGMILSSMALAKRTRRQREEAAVLYSGTFVASGALAWTMRPLSQGPVASEAPPDQQAAADYIDFVDREAARLERRDPQFADRAFLRLAHSPSVQPTWEQLPPFIQALVV